MRAKQTQDMQNMAAAMAQAMQASRAGGHLAGWLGLWAACVAWTTLAHAAGSQLEPAAPTDWLVCATLSLAGG
jgi:hypothetical protein